MGHKDIMNKIRYWDSLTAKWIMRHFYFMFFQIVLFVIFLFWFVNMFHVIDTTNQVNPNIAIEHTASTQNINLTIIVFIMLLNSFWMLYMFNTLNRMTLILKDISFNINRLRVRK